MISTSILPDQVIDSLLLLPEVIAAKTRIDQSPLGSSIYFTVDITPDMQQLLCVHFGISISDTSSFPMRWIKGDTKPHIDIGKSRFEKTCLAYLTDSEGDFFLDGEAYPISKGAVYRFPEGVKHETLGTGVAPRLLFGPMSEQGFSVGGVGILENGGTTIYIRQTDSLDINTLQYSNDQTTWNQLTLPVAIVNTNTSTGMLNVEITTDLTFNDSSHYFICNSSHIQFGSTSVGQNGSRPTIFIVGMTDYPGLISNGSHYSNGYSNINVFNLIVDGTTSTLLDDGGWFGQTDYGKNAVDNYIINCTSLGDISEDSGGIVGSNAAYSDSVLATLFITRCSSSGTIGVRAGGIVGRYSGYGNHDNGTNTDYAGTIVCEQCWSTGFISSDSGGIFGYAAGYITFGITGVGSYATKCYASGAIGQNSGGIFGLDAGLQGYAEAFRCYSTGNIANTGGGIFGNNVTQPRSAQAINCYSIGAFSSANGVYVTSASPVVVTNCYAANGNWSSLTANQSLTGVPVSPNVIGDAWVSVGTNQPYELASFGYTPYLAAMIDVTTTPQLIQTYSASLNSGESTNDAIAAGKSYTILQISGGVASSYGTISIHSLTGKIYTTSSTDSGNYTVYVRNTGSYHITPVVLTVSSPAISPICFLAGTPVLTDQGEIAIEKINTKIHTIRRKRIVAVTRTVTPEETIVCIEASAFGRNLPSRTTYISRNHKVLYNNEMIESKHLVDRVNGVYSVKYRGDILYNVLLETPEKMAVNNLVVETLHPSNSIARIYNLPYAAREREVVRINRRENHKRLFAAAR